MARQPKLIWAAPALDDLDDIAAFIALDDPIAAAKLLDRALKAVERLPRFPDSGRLVPEAPDGRYREVIVAPLRIICRREGSDILIVHAARGEQQLRRRRLR